MANPKLNRKVPTTRATSTKAKSGWSRATEAGHRSGLEDHLAEELLEQGVPFGYESEKIAYIKPQKAAKYTPDFILPNGIIIEGKGRFLSEDRQKHRLIRDQHPELDIRFVFSRSAQKLSKTSKTTYAAWCQQYGFKYADRSIPKAWIEEALNAPRSTIPPE